MQFIISLLLFLAAAYFPVGVGAHIATESGQVVIHMNSTGYELTTVTIPVGTRIDFENTDTVPHWPASDIHPTHAIYSDFDPKKPVEPGNTWSFTFNKPGTWQFHDHLFPTIIGSITVRASPEASTIMPSPVSARERLNTIVNKVRIKAWQLYYRVFPQKKDQMFININTYETVKDEKKLQFLIAVFGGDVVMSDLLVDTGNGSRVDCHQEAHTIGRIAFEVFGASVFQGDNASCHSGYYHGAMESFLAKEGTDNLAQKIDNLCNNFPTTFGRFECLHGVGHGVLAYHAYDMPKALEVCKELNTSYDQSSCYGGIFMENIITAQGYGAKDSHETKWVSQDPHFPCNGIVQDHNVQYECYQMQTSWMLTLSNYSFDPLVKECLSTPESMISVCFRSFGRDAAGQTLRDPYKIMTICDKVPKTADYYQQCIQGGLNVIVDFWGSKLSDQATQVCKLITTEYKTMCYQTLATRLNELFVDSSKKKAICSNFEFGYQAACRDI